VPKVYFSFYQQSKYIFTCIHIFSLCKSRSTAKKKFAVFFCKWERRKFYFFLWFEERKRQKDCYFIISVSFILLAFYCGSYSIIILYFYIAVEKKRKENSQKSFLFSFHPLQKFQWPFFSELWNFCVCKLSDFLLLLE
jgi:hypothetical protein